MIDLAGQCDCKKRLVIGVWQVQIIEPGRINREAVRLQLGQHFADALFIKLETWAGEYFGLFVENLPVVTHLKLTGQGKRENLGGIPLRLEQARHDHVGVEHESHFWLRLRRVVAISASMADMDKRSVWFVLAACWSVACACNARALRNSARVASTDAAVMCISTATGWPLEVTTKSPLAADFNHWLAGLFFNSLTEIVLMVKG